MPRRNDVGDWYTQGQKKCRHCGNYFPENWADSHVASCSSNPDNQTTDDDTEEQS